MHVIGAPTAHDIELADLDGDGDIDVVARNQAGRGTPIFVWEQVTPTSWKNVTIKTQTGEGLHVADIDRDGDKDIIAANRWYENNGGAWNEHIFTTAWNKLETITFAADINGDGRLDVVLTPSEHAGGQGKVAWYQAPPDPKSGNWTEHIVDQSVETVLHGLSVADIDGNGALDIITAEMAQGNDPDEVSVYLSGNNQGTAWEKRVIATTGSHNIRVADIGNDGDFDIFGANWSGGKIDLWENQGGRVGNGGGGSLKKWTYIEIDASRQSRAFGLAMKDVTGDRFGDIASGQYFYRNPGGDMTAKWSRTDLPSGIDALLMIDVDNDQFGDIIGMNSTGSILWLEAQDTQGSAWKSTQIGSVGRADHGMSSQGYATAQIVAGGKEEIIINVSNLLSYFQIPANPESGNWPQVTVSTSVYPEGVAAADIDKDGDIDLAGPPTDKSVGWWENPGTGVGNWTAHPIGSAPSSYADRFYSADVNGDKRLDIIFSVANGSGNGVYWYESPDNPKSGIWQLHTVVQQDTTNSLDIADMDRDGDIDIISGEHRGTKKLSVWTNDGKGKFTEQPVDSGKESHLGARVFDLDANGTLDIVSIAWDEFRFLHVWRNDGVGSQPGPGTSACHQITNPETMPQSAHYAPPYNIFSTARELLLRVVCAGTRADITVGMNDANLYTYSKGHIYKNGAWSETLFTGVPVSGTQDWLRGEGKITANGIDLSGPNYMIAFTCRWMSDLKQWKCGCRDQQCGKSYWQLQVFGNQSKAS